MLEVREKNFVLREHGLIKSQQQLLMIALSASLDIILTKSELNLLMNVWSVRVGAFALNPAPHNLLYVRQTFIAQKVRKNAQLAQKRASALLGVPYVYQEKL